MDTGYTSTGLTILIVLLIHSKLDDRANKYNGRLLPRCDDSGRIKTYLNNLHLPVRLPHRLRTLGRRS